MKILLTGSSGLLGSAVSAQAVLRGHDRDGWSHADIPIGAPEMLASKIAGYDWLVHCAANTDVEDCERYPARSYRDNFLLTDALVRAAARTGVSMAFVSSTGVYGQHKDTPYKEYDAAKPTTHHHRSKLLAESVVLSQARNLVIRTGWIFGGDVRNPKNFVIRRMIEAQNKSTLQSNNDQRGVPSYTEDVACRLLELLEQRFSGLFNCVNDGNASRFEYVKEILRLLGSPTVVEPVTSDYFKRLAPVSNNEMAENWHAEQAGFPRLPTWQASLARYLRDSGTLKE